MPIRLWRAEAGPASRLSVRSEMKVAQWRACLTGSATELAQHSLFRGCSTKQLGYRTKRVGFMVTFPLFGAEKSVLKLVGANLKDGQNVLVL